MVRSVFRRAACLAAMLGLGVASSPIINAAPVAPVASSNASAAAIQGAGGLTQGIADTGAGWGAIIGCAACAVGAGIVISGGPIAIAAAANTPGSAIAALACAATCYDAFL
jgi:hypothetical protein